MEAMTESMHDLAVKTKQETVSMKIITLVTLFFLPGTFIAVSCLLTLYTLVRIF
jgi:Mg2+ and Co2+ transporter CorA